MSNFESTHREELEQLFLNLSFGKQYLAGKLGANAYSPYDLLNMGINSIKLLRVQLKKEIETIETAQDEWSSGVSTVLENKKKWERFLYLLIGYKLDELTKNRQAQELNELKAQYKELMESNKTPDQKMQEIKSLIEKMGGSI
jgi:hypothetical protein